MRKILLVSLSLFLALALSPGSVPAVEKAVTVLVTGMLTGPGSSTNIPTIGGMKAAVAELNGKGGIDGVQINQIVSDDRYAAARALSFYQRYRKTPKLATLVSYGTPAAYVLDPIMTRDKIPQITMGGGRFQKFPGWTFLQVPPYQNMVGSGVDWAIADWKKKGKPGMPTFAYLGWSGPSGIEATNGSVQYAKQKGVKFLPPVFTPPGTIKYDTWLTSLDQQGADYIYIHMVDPDQTFVVRDAHGLGLTKKIQFMSSFYGLLDDIGLRLVNPELVEGSVVATLCILGEERFNHPFAKLWPKYEKKPLEEMPAYFIYGVGLGQIIQEVIRRALKEVGYEKFNGEAVYRALQTLKGDFTQGITGPQDLGPKMRMFNKSIKYYRVTNGKNVPISGWVEAPDCISLAEYK